ncbi:uncharacterized protein LOC118561453 [Fundulus heteroclitus]|uniref:uncharacterized protein LOC118561453 n=1 Tax=Fundulus heteroclitus TaxID=8078 RepID=UPI00165A8110|nr:uncharacterized protein LOC118561453 [Fundulus heteroclitus]XP_035989438.1 uncharacterized protein LOC118561453 [Fundulus heteroclitus]XP_035989439.1 uncharacterized protein LOC118561453 [Fundulus heteroclitus]
MDSEEELTLKTNMSSSLITVLIIVVLIFLLLLLKKVKRFANVVIQALENPKILGTLTLTIILLINFSSPPTTTVLVVVVATLWLHWLSVTIGPNQTSTDSKPGAKRLAVVVQEQSTLLPSQIGCLPLYKIPLETKQIDIKGCKSFTFGEKSMNCNRNIMVLGASGAGKSTVINAMVNYVLGVRWEDSFRFKLVDEGQSKSQGQTSEITLYKLYHQEGFRVNYSLTIVDTPGFGGTGGIDRDKEITEQLRDLFTNQEGVGEIDAVCFVVQAAITELTSTQRYVFDSALSIFGKDVAENIRVLVTYADEQQLPVLEAIKVSGVPLPQSNDGLPVHFKFNNSVLFASNKFSAIRRMFGLNEKTFELWKMGTKSMASFFDSLTHIRTIRLTMTKEVMEERKQLENIAEELQKKIKLGLAKLEEIRMTKEKLQEHEAEIRQNENFEVHISITKTEQVDISHTKQYITNCLQCHVTCHFPCTIPKDEDKKGCSAMGPDGYCTVCPGKCFWNVHSNQSFRWEYTEIHEKRTVKEIKEKYSIAREKKGTLVEVMRILMSKYESNQYDVVKLIAEAAKCLNRLKEIALNPKPLTTPEYINMLMKGEEQEAKPGWKERLQSLEKMKEKAEIIAKVEKGEKLLAYK